MSNKTRKRMHSAFGEKMHSFDGSFAVTCATPVIVLDDDDLEMGKSTKSTIAETPNAQPNSSHRDSNPSLLNPSKKTTEDIASDSTIAKQCGWQCCCVTFHGADFIVFCLLAGCAVLMHLFAHPYKRIIENVVFNGTVAHNPALSYPLVSEQVSTGLCAGVAVCVPMVVIVASALVRHCMAKRQQTQAPKQQHELPPGLELARVIVMGVLKLMQTLVLTVIVTLALKYIGGRPRPNFYAVGAGKDDRYLSFPSGHASGIFASMTFLSMYLWSLTKPKTRQPMREWLALPLLVLSCVPMVFAAWVAMTRTQDYKHNFDDVSVGSAIGIGMALLVDRVHRSDKRTQ